MNLERYLFKQIRCNTPKASKEGLGTSPFKNLLNEESSSCND